MRKYKDALQIIIDQAETLPSESVSLMHAYHRVLAEGVCIDMDMPPFNKSAMDGYACRKKDLNNTLTLVETIYAGKKPEYNIGENQCAKIMTGAVVPDGADCVFMIEDAEVIDENHVRCTNIHTKSNISLRGEDAQSGDLLLPASTMLEARHMPLLAMAGKSTVQVYRQPQVAIIASGTELVEPHETPMPFQIRNSNSSQLLAQLQQLNINGHYKGIIKDDGTQLIEQISIALQENDVLILTGGVSVGEYDLIPDTLQNLGYEIIVYKTAIQPGKPMVFAKKGKSYCFGLSGNPVSSFIQFELYTRPFLSALMGHPYKPKELMLPLNTDFSRKKDARLLFAPAIINESSEVVPLEFHGSAHINGLSNAQVLFEIPIGVKELKNGDLVNVRCL
ncbi:molybdopterin molybdotransferase MoeA [Carboxylicivirga mesophila]|uniref:Molybdopterin molybdenumtransferase n=1 Tax=Carboxylicivirga mesophila TaxID=1166478 RepID=A0ABS5K8Q1_9BACT|nr:gephyrin-like molybdotransferase Glp [Carboxylicivirga mesophila]MBS2210886.1 molybdopterin molybdotransferase MoeA [Carboxylicivirga mesophila]